MTTPLSASYDRLAELAAHLCGQRSLSDGDTTRLSTLPDVIAMCERLLVTEVAAARTEGLSWSEIGHWLGISKQAAWERYGSA